MTYAKIKKSDMKMQKISKEDARDFLVNYQGLNGAEKRKGPEGVLDYFNKVRCIQFDPLDVVGRNADLVLQSRISNYRSQGFRIINNSIYKKASDREFCGKIAH